MSTQKEDDLADAERWRLRALIAEAALTAVGLALEQSRRGQGRYLGRMAEIGGTTRGEVVREKSRVAYLSSKYPERQS